MELKIMKGLSFISDILLPRICLVCGQKLNASERHLCLKCLADMPQTYFWQQPYNPMSDRLNRTIQFYLKDGEKEVYAYAVSLFFYSADANYRMIAYALKYNGDIQAGKYFGRLLGSRIASARHMGDIDLIIPVPLHWRRLWERGYNQAEIIAGEISAASGAPVRKDILMRRRYTMTQTQTDVEKKGANVQGAFKIKSSKGIDGIRHILLVDDVFTTGNTAVSCIRALRDAFPHPVRISVATLGFVGQ